MTPLTISFPQPAPLLNLNDRGHHMPRARKIKAWRETAAWAARAQIPRRHPLRLTPQPVNIQLTLPVRDRRVRDAGNYYPVTKAVVDGIVGDAGLLPGDDTRWVTTHECEFRVDRGPQPMVYVTIWPREAAA